MSASDEEFDVVVIGGGPGGSATAGLLAIEGRRVLVIEREKFPRYHIGESLITGALPTLDDLGLRDRMEGMGFTKKYGGTLLWGKNQGTWGFRFTESALYDHAYQVRRAEFDGLWRTLRSLLRKGVPEQRISTRNVYRADVCPECGTPIRRWDLAGRWAYACPQCQAS